MRSKNLLNGGPFLKNEGCLTFLNTGFRGILNPFEYPGDFVTKVKQINSQLDLIWMLSFAGPSYLTIRSSVHIILI